MREGTKYFGVPTCPYCKKRVNLIRTWSLKRQGEYCCPRCGGISNIYLSPLIYVFALLAIFSGGSVYFFHKFVLDDIDFSIVLQVILPFAIFFLLSLFMVYLAKPVIKKVPKTKIERKRRQQAAKEAQRRPASQPSQQMFYDDQEYLPNREYAAGGYDRNEEDGNMKVVRSAPEDSAYREQLPGPQQNLRPARPLPPEDQPERAQQTVAQKIAASRAATPATQEKMAERAAAKAEKAAPVERAVSPLSPGSSAAEKPSAFTGDGEEDFFSKYNDPEYVQRRLKEMKKDQGDKK